MTRRLLRTPGLLYRVKVGWLLNERFLLLTHLGRRSGRRYHTVLEVIGSRPATGEVMVIAGLGRSADWYRNLQARPAVEVMLGRRRFRPVYRVLADPEAVAVLADYERRNRWLTPLVRRALSWLVGWPYDGSDAARRRLVRELPVVGFRPELGSPARSKPAPESTVTRDGPRGCASSARRSGCPAGR